MSIDTPVVKSNSVHVFIFLCWKQRLQTRYNILLLSPLMNINRKVCYLSGDLKKTSG